MKNIFVLAGLCLVSASVLAGTGKAGANHGTVTPQNSFGQESAASARTGSIAGSAQSGAAKSQPVKAKAGAEEAKSQTAEMQVAKP